ncbi:MAG: succinate dehydrogenase / fumarate reductase cytochrome b subunit [Candidatus Promineifilaceae bacterium]|jgi:succinate dehydrogenase / fumarate reductase cytochrome b subunit
MKLTTICKKIIMGVSGLILILFLIGHLIGNLTILLGAEAFNGYAHFLMSLGHGMLIYVFEAGIIIFFAAHVITGIQTALLNRSARDEDYLDKADAGGASRKTIASKTMIYTGLVMLLFIVMHVNHFKFGAGAEQEYVTNVHGEEARDLYRLVVEEFKKPMVSLAYVIAIGIMFFHLRHGFWSAFQSLGVGSKRLTPILNVAGIILSIILVFGFVLLPLYVLFFVNPPDLTAAAHGAGS